MNENRAMSDSGQNTSKDDASSATNSETPASSERHPNLTLLESGQNPGELLRDARGRLGLTLSQISMQTKINERQLEAIESGVVDRLPPETFAKAFIKSYCKAVRIEATPVLQAFGFEVGSAARATAGNPVSAGMAEPKMPSSSRRLSSLNFDRKPGRKRLGLIVTLAVIAGLIAFYVPVFMDSHNQQLNEQKVSTIPVAPANTSTEAKTSLPSGSSETTVQGAAPAANDNAQAQAAEATGGQAAAQTASTESTSTSTETAGKAAPVGNEVFPAIQAENEKAKAAATAASEPKETTSASSSANSSTSTPGAPQVVGSGEASLRFKFNDQSWVTVRDANDNVLLSRLNEGNSSIIVRGQAPFKIIVGNAKTVDLTMNGKPVDLMSSVRGEVARLTLE